MFNVSKLMRLEKEVAKLKEEKEKAIEDKHAAVLDLEMMLEIE